MDANNPQPADSQRLIALEEWVMHTDELLKQLNAVVCEVQDRLDRQDRTIARLVDMVKSLEERASQQEDSTPEPPPPHY